MGLVCWSDELNEMFPLFSKKALPHDFDRNALRDLAKEKQAELQQKKAELEAGKEDIFDSITGLTSQLSVGLNEDVSKAYKYQCRLNTEVKRLDKNIQEFGRQLEVWVKDISDVNSTLKDLGDTEIWSKKLKHDSQLVLNVFQSINN